MFIAIKDHSFYNLFIFTRKEELAKLSSSLITKEMMGEEIFQLHVATPTCATHPMSLDYTRQGTRFTGSYFPADVQQGLLSQLVGGVVYKFPTLKFCHINQTKWPLVIKHINWDDNHQAIINVKCHITSRVKEKCNLTVLSLYLWDLSVVTATKKKADLHNFTYI